MPHDRADVIRNVGADAGNVWILDEHRRQHLRHVSGLEQLLAGEHLKQDGSVGPNVRTLIDGQALGLLGGHVGRGPDHHPHLGGRSRQRDRRRHGRADAPGFRLERFGQPEVEHLHHAVKPHLDVGRFEIPMDHALLMRSFEGFGDLPGNGQRFINGDRALADPIRERRPFHQFKDERLLPFRFFQPVDVPDVGMVQRGQNFGFAFKAGEAIRIIRERLR